MTTWRNRGERLIRLGDGSVVRPGQEFTPGQRDLARILRRRPEDVEPVLVSEGVEEKASEFPRHVGGGTYELSNGDRVRGKDAAEEAEAALAEVSED